MNFLNPLFLLGLIAVAIPVVLHLINFRRPRQISFSTLSFFNELRESTLRRIRIKQYLLMALRALAVLFLAVALARPFLPPNLSGAVGTGETQAVAIVVDNSPSMSRIGSQGPLIDQAKDVATRIIDNRQSGDSYLISATNDNVAGTAMRSSGQSKEMIEDIQVVNTAHRTAEAVKVAYDQLQQNSISQHGVIYLISDGQKSQLEELENSTLGEQGQADNISLQLIKLEQPRQQNIAVTSLSMKSQMLSQQSPVHLAAEVENTGNAAAAKQYISLEVEGEVVGQYELSLKPGEQRELTFEIVPDQVGFISGRVVVEGDEVTFDNSRFFSLHIPENRSILLVNNDESTSSFKSFLSPALEAAYQTNPQLTFEVTTIAETDPSQWQDYDAIVLDGLKKVPEYWFQDLQQYAQNGRGILFFPSEEGEVTNYNRFFSQFNGGRFNNVIGEYASFNPIVELGELEAGHPILNELFILDEEEAINIERPSLFYYYHYQQPSNAGAMAVLQAANGDPLLTEHHFGEGVLLVSTIGTDPGWSNFPVNPLFAPLYYRSILYASSTDTGGLMQHQLGSPFRWESASQTSEVLLQINDIETKAQGQQTINGIQVELEGKSWQPGVLAVEANGNIHKIGVNQNVMESRFTALEQEQWQQMMKETINVHEYLDAEDLSDERLTAELTTAVFGKEIWNWFVWISLFLLLSETVVTRYYKAESTS